MDRAVSGAVGTPEFVALVLAVGGEVEEAIEGSKVLGSRIEGAWTDVFEEVGACGCAVGSPEFCADGAV